MKLLELLVLSGVAYSFKQRCKPKGGYMPVDSTVEGKVDTPAAGDDTATGTGGGNAAREAKEASDANWIRLNGVGGVDQSPNEETWPTWDGVVVDPNKAMAWDGVVVLQRRDGSNITAAACEGGLVKGMYAAYPIPFANPTSPTEQEVDEYTLAVIRQVFFHSNLLIFRYVRSLASKFPSRTTVVCLHVRFGQIFTNSYLQDALEPLRVVLLWIFPGLVMEFGRLTFHRKM
jgi:hypothetical protein